MIFSPAQGVGSTNEALNIIRHSDAFIPVASSPIGGKPGIVEVPTLFGRPIRYCVASLMSGLEALDREVGLDGVLMCTIGSDVFNSLPEMTKRWPVAWRYNINMLEFMDPGMVSHVPHALGTLGMVDAVVPCTKFVEDNLKQLGVENTTVIPTCLDTKECVLAKPTSDLVVSLMRIAPIKNVLTSILIAGKIINELPTAEYQIFGSGVMGPTVAGWVRQMGTDRISYMGFKPAEEVLTKAKVALQMSISENFSLSALEFLASGIPLVCSDIPGHPRSACRVNFDSIKEAAEAVKKLLTDNEYWEAKRREGLEEVKQYDVRKIVPQWETLFKRLNRLKEFKRGSK